jgi:hypothetical protein
MQSETIWFNQAAPMSFNTKGTHISSIGKEDRAGAAALFGFKMTALGTGISRAVEPNNVGMTAAFQTAHEKVLTWMAK